MSLVFDGLGIATGILTILYFILGLYSYFKLKRLYDHSDTLNTRKLFVMSCFLTCVLRVMSFGSLTAFNISDKFDLSSDRYGDDADDDTEDSGGHQFFAKSMIVLFDFPDFSIISAYMLLAVAWGEAFLQSRRHWLSAVKYRRNWLLGYLCFNTLLYSVQVALYSMIFLPSVNMKILFDLIYLTLTGINLVLPLLWMVIYLYLCIQFAGFPYSSSAATERLATLQRLAMLWTLARLSWGFLALTTVLNEWIVSSDSRLTYTIELIVIFLVTEMVPIYLSMRSTSLQALVESPSQLQFIDDGSGLPTVPYRSSNTSSWSNFDRESAASKGRALSDDKVSPAYPFRGSSVPREGSFDNTGRSSVSGTVSPRSSTSEYSPKYAGGWLWFLGM